MRMAAVFGADCARTPPFILDLEVEQPTRLLVESAIRKYLSGMNDQAIAEAKAVAIDGDDVLCLELGFDWEYGSDCGDLYVTIEAPLLADALLLGFCLEDREGLEL